MFYCKFTEKLITDFWFHMWANPFIGCDFKNTDDDFIEKGMEAFASFGACF